MSLSPARRTGASTPCTACSPELMEFPDLRECRWHSAIALPATAIDPICGMTVDIKGAMHTLAVNETTYYFCSAGCQDAFKVEAR